MAKPRIIPLSIILIHFFLPARVAFADTGPKPTMEFDFKFDPAVSEVTILSGILYECEQADCRDAMPLEDLGPQGLYCEPEGCRAIGYGFAPFHRLEVEFTDGVRRQSNIFETAGFSSKYTVTVRTADLIVEAKFNLISNLPSLIFLVGGICVLVGGVLMVGLIIFIVQRSGRE